MGKKTPLTVAMKLSKNAKNTAGALLDEAKGIRLTPAQMRYLAGAKDGAPLARPRAEGGKFGDCRVIQRLKALGLLVDDGLGWKTTAKGNVVLGRRVSDECAECCGKGEVERSCDECGVSIYDGNASEDEDLCDDCGVRAAKEAI